ncbi:MAG: hypothetical protein HZA89_13025 [Verrucomicrobia bacterium]|nr:hypothetical protein [Verrucomicrobiota bacterium]
MPDPAPNPDLLPSLRRLVRGLSALFWGLPLALLAGIPNVLNDVLRDLGPLPPLLAAGLLLFGVDELGKFQPQERVWQQAWERARVLALVNLGLAPFLFFWGRVPESNLFASMVVLLVFTGLYFLHALNVVLQRLAAMLPDETLRADTTTFTHYSLALIRAMMVLLALLLALDFAPALPPMIESAVEAVFSMRRGLFAVLVLAPVAITMTLLWKTKEAVLASIFSGKA